MDVDSNIAHLAYDYFVLVSRWMAVFTYFAVWAFPFQNTLFFGRLPLLFDQWCVQGWLMTASMVPFLAFVALKHIKLLFQIGVILTFLALFRSQRGAHCWHVLNLVDLMCILLLFGSRLLIHSSNFVHQLGHTLLLSFLLVTTKSTHIIVWAFWTQWNLILRKLLVWSKQGLTDRAMLVLGLLRCHLLLILILLDDFNLIFSKI